MANAREIVKRRQSVANIRKITRTMEMIATARFKKAFHNAVGSRPYTDRLAQMVASLSAGGSGHIEHPLLKKNQESRKVLLLVLTSNRGLCGGYNGNILRLSEQEFRRLDKLNLKYELRVSGKKGIHYFRFKGQEPDRSYTEFTEKTSYLQAEKLADEFIELYENAAVDAIEIIYTRFVSAGRFYPDVMTLLPIEADGLEPSEAAHQINIDDYIFSPGPMEILEKLIPNTVRTRLYQCFMDAIVSEQVSRMRAMKAATDNANQMIQTLTSMYNRARQTQITGELLDILGGVEALK